MNHLFCTYYRERNAVRRAELDLCLRLNADAFDIVHVLAENVTDPKLPGIDWRQCSQRQTYDDLLGWAREVSGDSDLVVLANCDLLIPALAVRQMDESMGRNDAYVLSRYEVSQGGGLRLYDTDTSQDVWAFRGKPRVNHPDFFGIPGCENRFAHAAKEAGYIVSNPSRSIKTIHVHSSKIRTELNSPRHRLPPPYLFVGPHHLGEQPTYRPVAALDQIRGEMIRSGELRRLIRGTQPRTHEAIQG